MADTEKTSNSTKEAQPAVDAAQRHANNAANALDSKLSGPLAPLEQALNGIFGEKAPYQLPKGLKETLVKIAPWLALIGGVLGVLSAYNLWKWAHRANEIADSINNLYGGLVPRQDLDLGLMFWLSIATTLLFSALALIAFPGLRAKKKVGWNLMFYSMLANIAYGVVSLFYSGGGAGSLIMSLIVSAIGLYILLQVRSQYKA
jgi:hypothetical protein